MTKGLHHVTAICGDPRRNHTFYTQVLGLRLVKKTVNFDDPTAYHLYYGDAVGSPGTALTFFAWPDLGWGRAGAGEAAAIHFSVPEGSLTFWARRLEAAGVGIDQPTKVLGRKRLGFTDPDGLRSTLVEVSDDDRKPWGALGIAADEAIRGFEGVRLTLDRGTAMADLLTEVLGYRSVAHEDGVEHFTTGGSAAGSIEMELTPGKPGAGQGRGSIHHIAFRTGSEAEQDLIRRKFEEVGLRPTPRIDRTYFKAIYVRAPGGVLFEVATDAPGFTVDEAPEALGTSLKLPPRYEAHREEIKRFLTPIES